MAHLLGTQSLSVLAGSRKLLEEVTLGIEDSSRIGILGPNGVGKSTLLCLIAGLQEPNSDQITKHEGVTVLVLGQADHLDPSLRMVDVIHPSLDEYEQASDPVVHDIHAGLFADVRLNAEAETLPGGQRRRIALAKVLAAPPGIVCLDEPASHLDVEGVTQLATHLSARFAKAGAAGALLVVTHSHWFLDTVCEHIWEVAPGVDPDGDRPQTSGYVDVYEGPYATYTLARAEGARQAGVAAHKRTSLLTKELAWLRRGTSARTSEPKFRIVAAETLITNVPPPRGTVELAKMASARLGKDMLDFEELSLTFTHVDGTKNMILDEMI